MPLYTYSCLHGCYIERFLTLTQHGQVQRCEEHHSRLTQLIQAPLLVKVCADVRYDSPINGAHITNHDARKEDMKRANCRPYDPMMRQDFERTRQAEDTALDASVDEHVERVWEKMDTKTRGKLASELVDQGADVSYVRSTA